MDLFVLIRTLTYVGLLSAALWLNRRCWRTLLLSAVVGASIFVPVPHAATPTLWYLQCLVIEVMVGVISLVFRTTASPVLATLSGLLCLAHATGMVVGPQPGFGPYRAIVPLLEVCQLLTCCLLSEVVMFALGQQVARRYSR
jgi:hypothetical protein